MRFCRWRGRSKSPSEPENVVPPARPLYFEASQIEQVLLNLLDNACKFTHRGGAIEVSGYPYFWERRFLRGGSAPAERRANRVSSPNSYRIDIKDTGPGDSSRAPEPHL